MCCRKYDIGPKLGKGAYGIVWKATVRKTRQTVALKKIFDAFQNADDSQRIFREIMFLQELGDHPNIVLLTNVLKPDDGKDIYLEFEYMQSDLHAVIRADILLPIHKQYIMHQLLKALLYMHSGDVVHRDIRPANLLLNSESLLKLAGFGLAHSVSAPDNVAKPALSDYVATRCYYAPEILLGSTKFTKGVDMWSVGCTLGELLGGKPMFPGTSTMNQLDLIIEITGLPSSEDLEAINSPFASTTLESLSPTTHKRDLSDMYPHATADALDLLRRCLCFNPEKRITAAEALEHKFLSDFNQSEGNPVCKAPVKISIDENIKYSIADSRKQLFQQILEKQRQLRKNQKAAAECRRPTRAIALTSYAAETDAELAFNQGDVLTITEYGTDQDWWYGHLNGTSGFVPSDNLIAIADPFSDQ